MVAFNNGIQRRRVSHQKGTQPSTRVGKIRQDCEDRVGWADKGSRHSDFIQMIIHWLGQQLHKSGNLKNRHFNSVWQHQGSFSSGPDLYLAVWWR